MILERGFLSPNRKPEQMIINNYKELSEICKALRRIGLRIVLTQGTYDLKHVGHDRYLMKAKEQGDVLIVGVDSDQKVSARKGPNRPVVPHKERLEQLCYLSSVNIVALKEERYPRLHLQKAVLPDVLIISESTGKFTRKELAEYKKYCGKIVKLEPQATTSTTAQVRMLVVDYAETLKKRLTAEVPGLVERLSSDVLGKGGDR